MIQLASLSPQLGITLFDEKGNRPSGVCTWQFNFKFSLQHDMFARDSIDLLDRSGIDFARFEAVGCLPPTV